MGSKIQCIDIEDVCVSCQDCGGAIGRLRPIRQGKEEWFQMGGQEGSSAREGLPVRTREQRQNQEKRRNRRSKGEEVRSIGRIEV